MAMMKYCCGVVVVMLLMGAFANAQMSVKNDLERGDIIVMALPGCCYYCEPGQFCPQICMKCRDVIVENGKQVTLEEAVGPYPLDRLVIGVTGDKIHCPPGMTSCVSKIRDIYCATGNDLLRLTSTALLKIGPGKDCDSDYPSISARIIDDEDEGAQNSSGHKICLRHCVVPKQSIG